MLESVSTLARIPSQSSLRWARLTLFAWIVALLLAPALTVALVDPPSLSHTLVEPRVHQLVECFCGAMAILISAVLLSGSLQRSDLVSRTFGLAFLCMGALDLLHAFTDPFRSPDLFVAFHTLSALSGSLIMSLGMLAQILMRGPRPTRDDLLFAGGALSVLLVVGYISETHMSHWTLPESTVHTAFSTTTHNLHRLAGALYGIGAILVYLHYRRSRGLLALFVAAILLLYAQSAFLFAFSGMWSFTWWLWHGAKVVLYFGMLATVFFGLRIALGALARFGQNLSRANSDLRDAEGQVLRVNRELENRNSMVRDAMASLHLNHAMAVVSRAVKSLISVDDCELVLILPDDEVDEFDRMIQRIESPWRIAGRSAAAERAESRDWNTRPGPDDGERGICLSLSMAGKRIGHLRLTGLAADSDADDLASVVSLTTEIGPIVNNALLYHRLQEANEFRSALLEVASMLTSTLNLGAVLHAVCTGSARLLDSDAAMVWLPAENGAGFTSVSSVTGEASSDESGKFSAWLQQRIVQDELLRGPDGKHRPLALTWPGDDASDAGIGDVAEWQALAMFPLTEESYLVGVMVLQRRQRVGYSASSLAKGALLAEQVRIAVNNAQTYRRLGDINRQLQLFEEGRERAEQLTFLGHMAASIAHEVRNPLSAMANCLSVLAGNCSFDDTGQAAIGIIRDELQRLNKLTHDFLLFGRPGVALAKPVMLARVLGSTCANLERHIAQEALAVKVHWRARACSDPIMIDPSGLETVLFNLLLNAAQAIDGSGEIRAVVHQTPRHFTIAVSDTGTGIPPEERQKIFDPFYSRKSHGAGLGLAIVHRFVRSWQGRIRIISEAGRGTTFLVRAPIPTLALRA